MKTFGETTRMRILVIEEGHSLAHSLKDLCDEAISIESLPVSGSVLDLPATAQFDLLLLDLDHIQSPGTELVFTIQRRWPNLPYVALTSVRSVECRVHCLDCGADDVLVKPVDLTELVARVRAVLRRHSRPLRNTYLFEDLEVNRLTHRVSRGGRTIDLSPKEYALLDFLLGNLGRPVTRAAIIEKVWNADVATFTNIVDVYINYLRHKIDLGNQQPIIRTVRGVGYQIGGN